jgi:two-component system response regulator FlrC
MTAQHRSNAKGARVLLADGHGADQQAVGRVLRDAGHRVTSVSDGPSAFREIVTGSYDLVLSEVDLPRMDGIELLRQIRRLQNPVPVVLVSGAGKVEEAVEAIKAGAVDFLTKPLTAETIRAITGYAAVEAPDVPFNERIQKHTIITHNARMRQLLEMAREVADSSASILIQGESGTGKELFARYIHHCSRRKDGPFVAINCAALPETLLESELFGYEKGAFTGAVAAKKGRFELAHNGTLLLDEISEMDYPLQAKLLRVLQEGEIDRIGARGPVCVDVRVVATTNRSIKDQIAAGGFREDLYYRLNVIPIHLPPLRDRVDDIPLLADFFIRKYNFLDNRSVKGLTDEALSMLSNMAWRGNVRELENTIERAVLLCKTDYLDAAGFSVTGAPPHPGVASAPAPRFFPLREMEKNAIFHALDQTNGNRTHAAEILGISVRTLRNKLNEYRGRMEMQ